MSLRIVYGRAGSGKTKFCLEEIKKSLKSNDTHPLLLIIPEQFSLQAEKSLARLTGSSGQLEATGSSGSMSAGGSGNSAGVFRAEALSFRRLAFRVFSEVGGISRSHLNSAGKSMLLFKVMDRLGSKLGIYSKAASKRGFTEKLSNAITEFKRYNIAPEELSEAAGKLPDGQMLKDKLYDLALIYREFEDLLHEGYMDADDDLVELYKRLDQSTQFRDAEIWIDEFSGFTPQEYNIIEKLLKMARRVTICLCTDCLSDEPGDASPLVFTPVRKTAVKLVRLALESGITVEKPVSLGTGGFSHRFAASEELGHLERNYYKYPYKKFLKYSGDVVLVSSANMFAEVEDVAHDIISLCRDKGYRYRDIAVTMRNPESYRSIVKSIFMRYGIPFFFDGKRNIDGHPLIVFILSALDIFACSWSYESVFRYARTGLTGVAREDLDLVENYVLENGIRGNAWIGENDWEYPVERVGGGKEPTEREVENIKRINAARRQLAIPLQSFRSKTKGGAKAIGFCTALFDLLCDTGAGRKIDELSRKFASEGLLEKADEYRQVWNIVMDVFSQIVEVLGDEQLGVRRFAEILAEGFAGHKIGIIPPSLDQVIAGSIERARSHDIKAMYILGVNEGVLPGNKGDEELISDSDRDGLYQYGLELAGNTASRSLEERFMIYMALATPSSYLWLSYPAADRDGKALRPSRLIAEVKRILPLSVEKSVISNGDAGNIPQPYAPEPLFDEFAIQLRRHYDGEIVHDGWKDIYKWFYKNDEWKEKCDRLISGISNINRMHQLSGDRPGKLYGRPVLTSVSRMEAYASCPFTYFVKYGLKAKERRTYSFDPVDAGSFMHNIIDEFSQVLVKSNMSWRGLDRNWCAGQVSKLVDKQLAVRGGGILGSSKRYIYLSERLKRTVEKAVLMISKHIEVSGFEPTGYEVEFDAAGRYPPIVIELPNGECIRLTGRIDRIDSMEDEDGTYIRIIDYKSGNKALKLSDVYYGLELQLITYLDAVLGADGGNGPDAVPGADGGKRRDEVPGADGGRRLDAIARADDIKRRDAVSEPDNSTRLPAGILYFRLTDPLIRCSRESSDDDIEKAIMRELRMKGLVLADVKLVRQMDKSIDGDSLIIPARINKDGTLGRSSAATMEQFGVLRRYVRKTLASIGSEILDGNISVSPYKKRGMTACTYCEFSSICQFDTSMRNYKYRIVPNYKEDELWMLMREAVGEIDNENI